MKNTALHILFLLLILPGVLSAQFMNIQIDIDPEVDATVEQMLDFGQLIAGSGYHQIELGSANMGVFHIRALRTQRLLVSLDADAELQHINPNVNVSIPIELYASYTNFGMDNYRESTAMSSLLEEIVIEGPPHNPQSTWSGLYIYIYGGLQLGDIPVGMYRGDIVLTIIYD